MRPSCTYAWNALAMSSGVGRKSCEGAMNLNGPSARPSGAVSRMMPTPCQTTKNRTTAAAPKVAWPRQTDRHLQLDAARSGGEDDDAIGEIHGLGDVVGDEERGLARFVPHAEELLLHRLAGLRVEGGERLVEQKQLGIRREGARQVHPLLHATRELRRPRVVEAAKADELDEPLSDTARLSAGTP